MSSVLVRADAPFEHAAAADPLPPEYRRRLASVQDQRVPDNDDSSTAGGRPADTASQVSSYTETRLTAAVSAKWNVWHYLDTIWLQLLPLIVSIITSNCLYVLVSFKKDA